MNWRKTKHETKERKKRNDKNENKCEKYQKLQLLNTIHGHRFSLWIFELQFTQKFALINLISLSLSFSRSVNVETILGAFHFCMCMIEWITIFYMDGCQLWYPYQKLEISLKSRWLVLFGFRFFHSDSLHEMPYQSRLIHI